MRYKKKTWSKIWIVGLILLLICVTFPSNVSSNETIDITQKDKFNSGMKTLFMKANCNRILLYKPWIYPVHIGPFWFTSELAYLCFFIEKDFVLRINGVHQEVELPAMVIPWKFIGLGPLYMIRNIVNPTDGNVTLIGICQDVVIEPYNI